MTAPDQLRAAMRAHDHEAPTDVPWPADPAVRPARSRTRPVLAGALVAAVLVAGGLVAVLWPRDTRTTPSVATADACPSEWPGIEGGSMTWVPAPATVPAPGARLVPASTPTRVLVCRFTDPAMPAESRGPSQSAPLTANTLLGGDLAPVAEALRDLPRAPGREIYCAGAASPDDDQKYLVGLTYDDGVVWVAARGGMCSLSTNGVFTTTTSVGPSVAEWLAAGRWTPPREPTTVGAGPQTCPVAPGRLGQETTMVPGAPTALTVCVTPALRVVTAPADALEPVMAALNAASTSPFTNQGLSPPTGDSYSLVFTYPSGPGVTVNVLPGSTSEVFNGSLQSKATGDLLPLLADLTR